MSSKKYSFRTFGAFLLTIALVLLTAVATQAQVGALRIVVSGRELPPEAKAEQSGTRVWLPVAPIARQLGYPMTIDNSGQTVKTRRVGVEAEFIRQTGEVRENGVTILAVPLGSGDIIFPPNPDNLLLPSEVVAALLDVSVFTDEGKNVVRVEPRGATDQTTSQQRGNFEIGGLNYNFDLNYQNGSFYPGLNLNSTGRIGDNTYLASAHFLGGGNYRLFNFYRGNFTLQRPNRDELQFGDLTVSAAQDLTLMNTLVRGASFTRPVLDDRAKISLFGGRSFSGLLDFNNLQRKTPALPFDTTIFGGRFSFQPFKPRPNIISRKSLSFSLGSVFYSGEKNKGLLLDGVVRYTTDKLNVEAELAAAGSNVERLDRREIKGFGTGIILSASYRPWNFLTLQGRYDRFSPNFTEPSRLSQFNNRETKSAGVSLRPFDNLSFGASASISENFNPVFYRGAWVDKLRIETYNLSAGYDPRLKFLPIFSLTATTIRNKLFGEFTLLNARLSRDFKYVRPFAVYYLTDRNGERSHGVTLGASVEAGKFGQFSGQHSFTLSKTPLVRQEDVQCQIEPLRCLNNFDQQFRVNSYGSFMSWSPRELWKILQLGVGAGYTRDAQGISPEFNTTIGLRLPFRQNLQFSYFHNSYNKYFRIGISGPLTFWKSKKRMAEEVTSHGLLTESKINGRIYLDENGNREFDPGVDKPMSGIRLRLNNGTEIVSDENGNYGFHAVAPGENHLAVSVEDIRADLVPANGLEQNLMILPRTVVNTVFRLVKSGTLSGRVWHDSNNNGNYDEGEGLRDIRVVSSSGRDTYTETDGFFLLSELPPGTQSVYIDERYKPEDLIIAALNLRIEVVSGQETKNIAFVFQTKPRGVKEIIFGGQPSSSSSSPTVKDKEQP